MRFKIIILLFFFSCSGNTANKQAYLHKENGVKLLSRKEYMDAIEELDKAIKKKKDYDTAYLNLGIAYLAINNCEEAKSALKKAIDINPDITEWKTALATACICLEEYAEAKIILDALNIGKETEIVYSTYALYYMNIGDYGRALYNLTRATELNPQNHGNYSQRALLYYNNEEFESALKDINKAIDLDSTNQEYLDLQLMIIQELNKQ